MKRFTDTEIWGKPWFRKLPTKYKNFWKYLCDKCDNAGVWVKDIESASYYIGETIDEEEALRLINEGKERIEIINHSEKWSLTGFISFHYGELTPDSTIHRGVIKLLLKHELPTPKSFKIFLKRVSKGYQKGIHTLQDKDKDKDKNKDKVFSYSTFKESNNKEFKDYLKSIYPEVDIELEFKKMESWLKTNPNRRYVNYGRFTRNWIDRTAKEIQKHKPTIPKSTIGWKPTKKPINE